MFCSEHVSFGSRAATEYVRTMAKSTHAWLTDFDFAVEIDDYNMRVEKLASKVEEAHKEKRELGGQMVEESSRKVVRPRSESDDEEEQEGGCQTSNQRTKKLKTPNQQMEDDFMECMVKSGFFFA